MNQFIKANQSLGFKIREIRRSKGFTQEAFVAQMQVKGCDMTRSTFAKVEAGIRHISVFELQTIVSILQIDYNELFSSIDK